MKNFIVNYYILLLSYSYVNQLLVLYMINGKFWYLGIAKQIAAAGCAVFAFDYPGFGLSEGLHGYISSFDELPDTAIEHYRKVKGVTQSVFQ